MSQKKQSIKQDIAKVKNDFILKKVSFSDKKTKSVEEMLQRLEQKELENSALKKILDALNQELKNED